PARGRVRREAVPRRLAHPRRLLLLRRRPRPAHSLGGDVTLYVVPVSFSDACQFITMWHRHHEPPNGHRFSVGVADEEKLVGVAIVSHPIARHLMDGRTLE